MKKNNPILILLLIISVSSYSQGLLNKLKKETKKVDSEVLIQVGTEVLNQVTKKTDDKSNSSTNTTSFSKANSYSRTIIKINRYYYWIDNIIEFCKGGGKQIPVSRTEEIPDEELIKVGREGSTYLQYLEYYNCNKSDFQKSTSQTNPKPWEMGVQYDLEKNIVMISCYVNPSSKGIWLKEKSKSNHIKLYSLTGNDIIVKKFKIYDDIKVDKFYESTKLFTIKNREVLNPKGGVFAQIIGPEDNNSVLKVIVAVLFSELNSEKAEIVNHVDDDSYAEYQEGSTKRMADNLDSRITRENNFLKQTKKCLYCNKEFTGEAFGKAFSNSSEKPCEKVELVYYDYEACCSRKCALDYCHQTHK
jgi:hypothetical protein